MEVVPANKTRIILFIIDKIVHKLWKVSKGMRKRVKWILKHKDIKVSLYSPKALVLNDWIKEEYKGIGTYYINHRLTQIPGIESVSGLIKGISNYKIESQKQLDILASLNGEVRCFDISVDYIKPTEIHYVKQIFIGSKKFQFYSKCYFKRIGHLCLRSLPTEQIKLFLNRVNLVDTLTIRQCKLAKLDLRGLKIENFEFDSVKFTENVLLPYEIGKIKITKCKGIKLLVQNRVREIEFQPGKVPIADRKLTNQDLDWIKRSKGLKSFETCVSIENLIFYFLLPLESWFTLLL